MVQVVGVGVGVAAVAAATGRVVATINLDRKSTRLNSSHLVISYAVFCLKKKKLRTRYRILVQLIHSQRFFLLIFRCFRIGVIPILTLPSHRIAVILIWTITAASDRSLEH